MSTPSCNCPTQVAGQRGCALARCVKRLMPPTTPTSAWQPKTYMPYYYNPYDGRVYNSYPNPHYGYPHPYYYGYPNPYYGYNPSLYTRGSENTGRIQDNPPRPSDNDDDDNAEPRQKRGRIRPRRHSTGSPIIVREYRGRGVGSRGPYIIAVPAEDIDEEVPDPWGPPANDRIPDHGHVATQTARTPYTSVQTEPNHDTAYGAARSLARPQNNTSIAKPYYTPVAMSDLPLRPAYERTSAVYHPAPGTSRRTPARGHPPFPNMGVLPVPWFSGPTTPERDAWMRLNTQGFSYPEGLWKHCRHLDDALRIVEPYVSRRDDGQAPLSVHGLYMRDLRDVLAALRHIHPEMLAMILRVVPNLTAKLHELAFNGRICFLELFRDTSRLLFDRYNAFNGDAQRPFRTFSDRIMLQSSIFGHFRSPSHPLGYSFRLYLETVPSVIHALLECFNIDVVSNNISRIELLRDHPDYPYYGRRT